MTDDPWANDKLGRKADGEHLKRLLLSRYRQREATTGSYVLNIDARWGEGKTFFLDCLAADLSKAGHLVARVNAWEDDVSSDPMTTVMAAIDDALAPFKAKDGAFNRAFRKAKSSLGVVVVEAGKQVALHAIKTFVGVNVSSIADALKDGGKERFTEKQSEKIGDEAGEAVKAAFEGKSKEIVEDNIQAHRDSRDAVRAFKSHLADALVDLELNDNVPRPLFVFVDELDRCRPTYAIQLLEEMKHLFQVKGVVFVVATDTEQLSHSIKVVYGSEFDARRYLRRFFDAVFVFPDVNKIGFTKHLCETIALDPDKFFFKTEGIGGIAFLTTWAKSMALSNRDLVQCFEIISVFQTSWPYPIAVEPFLFLTILWAVYVHDDCLEPLLNMVSPQRTPQLGRWSIKYSSGQYGRPNYESISAQNVIDQLMRLPHQNLPDVYRAEHENGAAKAYLENEAMQVHGGRFSSNQTHPSVIREYAKRIISAGHYVMDA